MKVEIIYALPQQQQLFCVEFDKPVTVREVILESHILHKYPNLGDIQSLKVGIYGQIVNLDHPVKDRDRVEIYRNLTIDPKKARILRVKKSAITRLSSFLVHDWNRLLKFSN